jgi:hypothetical protein
MKLKALFGLYVAVALVTLILQLPQRYPACAATGGCGVSLAKGVVWSAIWPAYWSKQLNLLK